MRDETLAVIFAMLCVTVLEAIALFKGIDGALLASSFTVIGSLLGYLFGKKKKEKVEGEKSG